jgi:site-specific recombinase XerD
MRRLCDAPDRSTLKGLRDAALLHTLASSGVRVSEAATLTIEQVVQKTNNGKAGYLLLVRGKTDEEAREAPLSPEAYAAILAWRKLPDQLIVTLPGPGWTGRALAGAAYDDGGRLADGAVVR